MRFLDLLRVSLGALVVHKGRSALTSLGIIIGIAAVIALVSAGDGARTLLDDRLDSLGKNLVIVRPGARTQQNLPTDTLTLTRADADAIRAQVGPLLAGVAETQLTQRVALGPGGSTPTAVCGSTPELQTVRQWRLQSGRFLIDDEVRSQSLVCVLGETVRRKLFPSNSSPLGQTIRIDQLQLRVVGVLAPKGRSPTGSDQDDQVFIPLTTLQRRLVGYERLTIIATAVKSAALTERARQEIERVLRERHRQKPGAEAFDVSSVSEMTDLARTVSGTLEWLIAVIAALSLLVGGIGIMNIMLVSVTERTREIGLRMAIGATPADVLLQFLVEATVLSLAGGLLGVLLGGTTAALLAWVIGWPLLISPTTVLLACGVSAGVGIFFGYYPALKASRLDPIVALRQE